jgi:hypothetical protein
MGSSRRIFCAALASAAAERLVGPRAALAAEGPALKPDLKRDPALARRIRLRSEGMPVSRVLRAVSEAAGVRLSVSGRAGDERLIAFVPEAPVADVMRSIAELYRLEWLREGGERPTYRLIKQLGVAHEESLLRERSLRGAVDYLQRRIRAGEPTEEELKYSEPEYLRALPLVAPLLTANLGALLRDGYVYLPISRLEAPLQARLSDLLQPALDRHNERSKQFQAFINQKQAAEGKPALLLGGADGPPPPVRKCTLIAELRYAGTPAVWLGLRDPNDTQCSFLNAPSVDLSGPGRELYRQHTLWPAPDAGAPPRPEVLTREVSVVAERGIEKSDWIARLRQLAGAAGLPLYSDLYCDYENGMDRHPRGGFSLPEKVTPGDALDTFCRGPRGNGPEKAPHSFWWFDTGSAFIRSSRWLWDEESVLPADLVQGMAEAVRKTERLAPRHVGDLARLTGFQVMGNGYVQGDMDTWALAVRAPARLTPASQALTVSGGLEWARLSPAEQELLLRMLPPPDNAGAPHYRASIAARPENAPAQGGAVLQTELRAEWGGSKGEVGLLVPLPGLTPKGMPRPESLEVERR